MKKKALLAIILILACTAGVFGQKKRTLVINDLPEAIAKSGMTIGKNEADLVLEFDVPGNALIRPGSAEYLADGEVVKGELTPQYQVKNGETVLDKEGNPVLIGYKTGDDGYGVRKTIKENDPVKLIGEKITIAPQQKIFLNKRDYLEPAEEETVLQRKGRTAFEIVKGGVNLVIIKPPAYELYTEGRTVMVKVLSGYLQYSNGLILRQGSDFPFYQGTPVLEEGAKIKIGKGGAVLANGKSYKTGTWLIVDSEANIVPLK